MRQRLIVVHKRIRGSCQNVTDCCTVEIHLFFALPGKRQIFLAHLLYALHHIDRVVGDTLKIRNTVQQRRHLQAVLVGQILTAQLRQICGDLVVIDIDPVLLVNDILCFLLRILAQHVHRLQESISCHLRHLAYQ